MNAPTQTPQHRAQGALRAQDGSARRFHLLMAVLAAALIAFELVTARLAHLGTNDYFLGKVSSLALLGAVLWYCRWRSFRRLGDACGTGNLGRFVYQRAVCSDPGCGKEPVPAGGRRSCATGCAVAFCDGISGSVDRADACAADFIDALLCADGAADHCGRSGAALVRICERRAALRVGHRAGGDSYGGGFRGVAGRRAVDHGRVSTVEKNRRR